MSRTLGQWLVYQQSTHNQSIDLSLERVRAVAVRLGLLQGDTNGSRIVTVLDLVHVNAQLGKTITNSNYIDDVNQSGIITVLDKVRVNSMLGTLLPAP